MSGVLVGAIALVVLVAFVAGQWLGCRRGQAVAARVTARVLDEMGAGADGWTAAAQRVIERGEEGGVQ